MNNIQRIICCCVSAMLSVAYIVPQTTCVFAQEVSSQDEAQPFTATLDDDFIANKLALMFKYDFTKQDIETTIAPKLIETIGSGKLKEFEYLDTVNIDDENSRQMYIALLDLEDSDKQSAYEIAVDLYETGYFYSVEVNMVGIPADLAELDTKDEAQPFTATLDDDFITNKLALMFKYDFTKQDIETTIAPKLIETIGGGKLKEFEYLDTVNIDDENSRQMYIALLDPEDTDKQSAYEVAADLYGTGYFYSVEVNMVGIPSITETTTTMTTTTKTDKTATTTDITNTAPYLSEFFELSLSEIEEKMNEEMVNVYQNEANYLIVVNVSNNQLRKLISELEPQKDEIGNDAVLFRVAFFNLFLDKLHLTGIYDTVDAEYNCATMPSAWWDPMNPFVVEESDDSSEVEITLLYPDYQEEYVFENGNERVTVDKYEAALRSLYVINTYGNKDYFTWAYKAPVAKSPQTTENTTEITTTTTTATTPTDIMMTTTDITTTTTTATDETNINLPQTGINSMTKILIAIAALMLTATGAGAVYYSGILRRTEDDK